MDAEHTAWQQAGTPSPATSAHHRRSSTSNSGGILGSANLSHGRASNAVTHASTPNSRSGARSDRLQASASPASTRRKSSSSMCYSTDRTSFAKSPGACDGGIGSPGSRDALGPVAGPPPSSLIPHRSPPEASEESQDSEAGDGGADDATALVLEHSACGGEWEWVGKCALLWCAYMFARALSIC